MKFKPGDKITNGFHILTIIDKSENEYTYGDELGILLPKTCKIECLDTSYHLFPKTELITLYMYTYRHKGVWRQTEWTSREFNKKLGYLGKTESKMVEVEIQR